MYWVWEDRAEMLCVSGCGQNQAISSSLGFQAALGCLQKDWLAQVSLRDGGGYRGRLRYGAFPVKKCPPARRNPGTNPALHLVPVCPQEVLDIVVHVSCRGGINAEIKIENKNTESNGSS